MGKIVKNHIKLDEGTVWPHPDSQDDYANDFSKARAYEDLLTHPWGTEVSIKKLRELRRTLRAEERARKEGER